MDRLELARCRLRPWRSGDEAALARQADDREIWRQMRDQFPHPYTAADARAWVAFNVALPRPEHWVIELDGALAGGIGLLPGSDVHRLGAEIGYWLGRGHWGRGLATEVLRAFTPWALDRFGLVRLEAAVFETNPASMRVLEKCGYQQEGVRRAAVFKDGRLLDLAVFAFVRRPASPA